MGDTPAAAPQDQSPCSSWGVPFTVVSSLQLVEGVPAPGEEELDELVDAVMDYIDLLEEEGAVMIAGFEGEMVGHGGELVAAAFLPTSAVDRDKLLPFPPGEEEELAAPGLLLDLRCGPGVEVLRRVMESEEVTKLSWGASAALQSLMHQDAPTSLDVQPRQIVDLQLAFSEPDRGLGMAEMLESVPASFVAGLPGQLQIDFDSFYSRNRRAAPLPWNRTYALQAMDNLHRIEAILRSKKPPRCSYLKAGDLTEVTVRETDMDPFGMTSLRSEMASLRKSKGIRELRRAVEIKRHILGIYARGGQVQRGSYVATAERTVDAVLKRAGVTIPADRSFS